MDTNGNTNKREGKSTQWGTKGNTNKREEQIRNGVQKLKQMVLQNEKENVQQNTK